MKEKLKLDRIKDFLGKFSKKTKIAVGVGTVLLVAAAIIIALVLNHKDYTVLFSGLTEEEAQQIVGKLQETQVEYQYKGDGVIMVTTDVADKTRAQLVYEGYPKSGFTYDVFIENAKGMTTDTEKQQYKIYELQDRIGATIRQFDGVKDAKVNIALKEEQKYALTSEEDEEPAGTASVTVTMENGGSPTEKQAAGIQRLVARSVPNLEMEQVSVFNGEGIEVSVADGSEATSGDAGEEIAQLIENQISKKVINVLGPFYGPNNVKVSAKGKVNMERVVRETTTYNTPEKKNADDKTGIVSSEETTRESSGTGTGAGGVAGTETNADVTQYNTQTGTANGGYQSETAARDYLVNQIKEQGEIQPGVLEDLTISVSINSDTLKDLSQNEIRDLVGNATGLAANDRADKITVVNAPFYAEKEKAKETVGIVDQLKANLPVIIVAAVIALIIIIILVIILKKRRANKQSEEEEFLGDFVDVDSLNMEQMKPEILNLKNERSRELRESVRDFAEQNPEISAQMIKNWLNGGGADAG